MSRKLGLIAVLGVIGSTVANGAVLYDNLPVTSIYKGYAGTWTLAGTYGMVANKFSTLDLCPLGCELDSITLNMNAFPPGDTSKYQLQVFPNVDGIPGESGLHTQYFPIQT